MSSVLQEVRGLYTFHCGTEKLKTLTPPGIKPASWTGSECIRASLQEATGAASVHPWPSKVFCWPLEGYMEWDWTLIGSWCFGWVAATIAWARSIRG